MLCQAQLIEGPEEARVVGEAGETFTVRRVRVVEARVTCFDGFEATVESLGFDADFGDEVFGKVSGEIWRVGGGWVRK